MRQMISCAAKSWQHDNPACGAEPSNRQGLAQLMQAGNDARKRFISAVRSGSTASLFTAQQAPIEASPSAAAPQPPRAPAPAPAADGAAARDAEEGPEDPGPGGAGWWGADWREEEDEGRAALRALLAAQFRREVARLRAGGGDGAPGRPAR